MAYALSMVRPKRSTYGDDNDFMRSMPTPSMQTTINTIKPATYCRIDRVPVQHASARKELRVSVTRTRQDGVSSRGSTRAVISSPTNRVQLHRILVGTIKLYGNNATKKKKKRYGEYPLGADRPPYSSLSLFLSHHLPDDEEAKRGCCA